MKDKNYSENKKINSSKSSNLFLNLTILLLASVIIFMVYSLAVKLQNAWSSNNNSREDLVTSVIQVEVLNGCGTSGIAEKFTSYLRQKNFDVVQTGNYFSFDINNSMVIDRTGNIEKAFKVAESLGIDKKHVIQQKNDDYFLDVSLIIGKDFIQLKAVN